jgi:hypothetical protein
MKPTQVNFSFLCRSLSIYINTLLAHSLYFVVKFDQMVDLEIVCCMCGDVGFRDKLFRCNKCGHRFQHS